MPDSPCASLPPDCDTGCPLLALPPADYDIPAIEPEVDLLLPLLEPCFGAEAIRLFRDYVDGVDGDCPQLRTIAETSSIVVGTANASGLQEQSQDQGRGRHAPDWAKPEIIRRIRRSNCQVPEGCLDIRDLLTQGQIDQLQDMLNYDAAAAGCLLGIGKGDIAGLLAGGGTNKSGTVDISPKDGIPDCPGSSRFGCDEREITGCILLRPRYACGKLAAIELEPKLAFG